MNTPFFGDVPWLTRMSKNLPSSVMTGSKAQSFLSLRCQAEYKLTTIFLRALTTHELLLNQLPNHYRDRALMRVRLNCKLIQGEIGSFQELLKHKELRTAHPYMFFCCA